MVTELLYQKDSYLKEFTAVVKSVDKNVVVLDRTAFNPRSGGLEHDTGYIIKGGRSYRVVNVVIDKNTSEVLHHLETPDHDIAPGDEVKGVIDWDRRYRIMRMHTAAHIISAIMYRDYGALITGGNIDSEKAYDDYSLQEFNQEIFRDAINKANQVVQQGIEVKIYWLKREEALKIPGIVKLASRMPPEVEFLRIVEIPGVDIQADGGPHVRNTREIGEIVFLKAENKGRNKKRLYYTVKP
ncbi:alanyl-tRNA editing protein AlaXM [Ignisphaera sp. 4213-co]|uniref:Alanyl-tRNA editing protein AlaXM n=1 Tax=Ignisphaera cupida TaxID=3050454 RepID=A0ABD4Z6K1_9CREN|nr:alanyl-tRNA editing protein AlaXM [Ignisphaera sp. 4213-co]MDK6028859.1 alanyl-tRNA editing protein AlaXM [Ignisphaera sp. 4213-co]